MPRRPACVFLGAVLAVLAPAPLTGAGDPPAAPKRPVTNEYHGTRVVDEYQWLENWDDPEVKAWSEAQNRHARGVLDSLPHVPEIRTRVTEVLTAPTVSYGGLAVRGDRLFAIKRQPPKQQPFLIVMDSPAKPDPERARVLVDPNQLDPTGSLHIDWFVPSPDGRLVGVSLSRGGTESGDLHVFDVETGKQVDEVIQRVNGGTAGGDMCWTPDSKGFFYTRYPRQGERPAEDMDFYMHLWFRTLGTPVDQDRYEIGKDFPKIAEIQVESAPNGVVLLTMQKGDGGEFQHYVRQASGGWSLLADYDAKVDQATLAPDGAAAYLIVRRDAPRGRLMKVGLGAGDDSSREIVAQGEDTIVSDFWDPTVMEVTPGRLYLTYQTGGPSEVRVFDLAGKPQPGPKQLSVSAVGGLNAVGSGDAILFNQTSYIDPPAWYVFDPAAGTTTRTALATPSRLDFSPYEVVREMATSKDGTKVPINIIRRKGLALDGAHPCVLSGYGGYGVNITPGFSSADIILLEQGVVLAEANIRGGGEFGEEWHHQGNLTNKQNVFDDFAAAARHLVERGYTNPKKLAIQGGSNGGLLMGAMITQHPEMFAAVVSHVGIYDMLRVELSSNGAFNIPEFGTVANPEQFRAMHAYSPYHRVESGRAYPPVLFLTGANDPRVDPMHSRKMTARLQDAGADVLLRTSGNTGHGGGTPLNERIEQQVDVNAFLVRHLGIDYRPAAAKAPAGAR
ncbi:MAG TPA: prolyl oligopeptidase family serine peptidase [Phycisphaerales bacterium]|nr:prolyl oligopeptidase family serine peptidase [Phycisphaerales bacterium]